MSLDDQIRENDTVYSEHDVKVIVDDRTMSYLQSATIKFVEENGRSGFQLERDNPDPDNAGCAGCASASSSCC